MSEISLPERMRKWEYFRDEWLKRWSEELVAVQDKAGCDPYQEEGKEPWERESTQEESET